MSWMVRITMRSIHSTCRAVEVGMVTQFEQHATVESINIPLFIHPLQGSWCASRSAPSMFLQLVSQTCSRACRTYQLQYRSNALTQLYKGLETTMVRLNQDILLLTQISQCEPHINTKLDCNSCIKRLGLQHLPHSTVCHCIAKGR